MKISATALAKKRGIDTKELFSSLTKNKWIFSKDGKWQLTKEGRIAGGDIQQSTKYGEYIVWPDYIDLDKQVSYGETFSSTKIGSQFNLSAQKVNRILAELGLIEKGQDGWLPTALGERNGALKMEASAGQPYVVWDQSILTNKHFLLQVNGEEEAEVKNVDPSTNDDFRKKFPAEFRTSDGHYVRSRAEKMIDDFLYTNSIVHAYERRVPIDEEMYCDFFLPSHKLYIEYWGLEENEKYLDRKRIKLGLYSKYKLNLVEVFDNDIKNLDETLAAKLRRHNITID